MDVLYLVCLLIGGSLLLLSLVAHHDGSMLEGLEWLNIRAVVSGVAFFGLAGVIASFMQLTGFSQFAFALVAGVAVAAITNWLFSFARREDVTTQVASLIGRVGRVLVAPREGQLGKVRLNVAGQTMDMLAFSPEVLSVGDRVIVITHERGHVEVRRWDGRE